MSEPILFTDTQNTLFRMLASTLFDRSFTPSEDTDWMDVLREANAQTVIPTVFYHASGSFIPEDHMAEIKRILRLLFLRPEDFLTGRGFSSSSSGWES